MRANEDIVKQSGRRLKDVSETKLSLRPNQSITSLQPECKDDTVGLVSGILIGNSSFSSVSYTGWTNTLRKNSKLRGCFKHQSQAFYKTWLHCGQCLWTVANATLSVCKGPYLISLTLLPQVNKASLLKRVVFTERLHYLHFIRCYSCFVHKIMIILTWQSCASILTDRNSTLSL